MLECLQRSDGSYLAARLGKGAGSMHMFSGEHRLLEAMPVAEGIPCCHWCRSSKTNTGEALGDES